MATNNPLLVPVNVEAFVVNQNVLQNKGVNIQRWQFAYSFLNNFTTPQPKAFTGKNDLPGTGTILHWTLPEIIRNGKQTAEGNVGFPLAPNRWLVVRYSGPADSRQAVAWVVQSDALGNGDRVTGGAPYLQPNATAVQPTYTGQVVALSNWNEPNPPSLFLTAVAPGNNMFAAFQPYCWNVFSLFDPLTGVANQDTLSYFVAGWYSNADDDIVATWQQNGSFSDFLATAKWQLAQPSDDTSTWALYHSMVWGIDWDINGAAPTTAPHGTAVNMALGNTAVDALTALIESQAAGVSGIDPKLLEALQYGLLPAYDQPDAAYELEQQIKASWFGSGGGGYAWEVVNAPVDPATGDPPPPMTPEERATVDTWLAGLNQTQVAYDEAVRTLAALQWALYQTWWKYNNAQSNGLTDPYPEGTSQEQFEAALNPANSESLVSRVYAQQGLIAQLAATIPTGATQAELQAAIAAYAQEKGLPETRILKQYAQRPFSRAYDPVILMQGLKNDALLVPVELLQCRFMDQLVTGFRFGDRSISLADVQGVIPVPGHMEAVPPQLVNLLQEFFLLDPTNATMIAEAALGTSDPQTIEDVAASMYEGKQVDSGICPDLELAAWTPPWAPLILLWDVVWYPVAHDHDGTPQWTFDGEEYTWNGVGFDPTAPTWEYQSMVFMTPQASFNFRAQLEKFISENPDNEAAQELEEFIENTDNWDFLSQSFLGLTPRMNLRNPDPNVSASVDRQTYFPDTTLADLVASSATYVPQPGMPQPQPFQPWPPSGFQDWRAGQFLIRRLTVVDKFGQTCELVTSETQLATTPVLAPSLRPQFPVINDESYRFVQLPPRILQPARLNLDFVSCADDDAILGLAAGVNPVCAWLLHNYLDESITCYDQEGHILGAVWVITNEQQQQVVNWTAAPNSDYATIADLVSDPDLNHLGLMLQNIQQSGPDALISMLETLDNAALTIDDGVTSADIGMTLLAGRPIAMVRMRLQFELEGEAVTDPSWRFTFAPKPNPVTGWTFNVRMGEAGRFSDGLVGYFCGNDYQLFYAPNVPENLPDLQYVVPVGTGSSIALPFDGATAALLTVLMDPRAVVHATTGILPTINTGIPQEFVGSAFANIDLTFNVGPLLTDAVIEADAVESSVVMPRPSLKNGVWSWQQFDGSAWVTQPIMAAAPTARFNNVPSQLRDGLLRLSGPMKKDANTE